MTPNMNRRAKRVFKVVFLTQFIDLLAFTLILPLLPKLLDYYASNDDSGAYDALESYLKPLANFFSSSVSSNSSSYDSTSYNGSDITEGQTSTGSYNKNNQVLLAGLLGSWFSSLQFISSPLIGSLSDRLGRKPLLLAAMFGSLLSYALWYISINSFGLFILSRTIGGLSKANVGLSLAVISDVSDENTRGRGMALIGFSFSLAFISGPMLGAYLTSSVASQALKNAQIIANQLILRPSMIAMILSFSNFLLIAWLLEETNPPETKQSSKILSKQTPKEKSIFNSHYINPRSLFAFTIVESNSASSSNEKSQLIGFRENHQAILRKIGLIYFYYLLFYSGLEFTLSFLTHIRFGFSSMDQGKLYLFSGILMAFIQGGFVRQLKGGRESHVAMFGLVIIIPAFILMGLSSTVVQIYISLALYSMSAAVTVPCLTTVVSTFSPPDSKGAVMGILRSLGALARALGPCVASLLFWALGPTVCYLTGAIALLLPVVLMTRMQPILSHERNMADIDNNNKLAKKMPTSLPSKKPFAS